RERTCEVPGRWSSPSWAWTVDAANRRPARTNARMSLFLSGPRERLGRCVAQSSSFLLGGACPRLVVRPTGARRVPPKGGRGQSASSTCCQLCESRIGDRCLVLLYGAPGPPPIPPGSITSSAGRARLAGLGA